MIKKTSILRRCILQGRSAFEEAAEFFFNFLEVAGMSGGNPRFQDNAAIMYKEIGVADKYEGFVRVTFLDVPEIFNKIVPAEALSEA